MLRTKTLFTDAIDGTAPMNEAVEYVEFDFDTAFDSETKYRGPPTPELEAAWEELWNGKVYPIGWFDTKTNLGDSQPHCFPRG